MATRFSTALHPDASLDANFQALAQFVEDTLVTTGGWVVTADTGQTLPSALTHPTSPNQKKGYRIYRMNDTLQSTAPCFMRVDYGSNAVTSVFAMWLTIGTGSDGVGNITSVLCTAVVNGSGSFGGSTTQPTNSYGSAAPNRCAIAMCVQSVSTGWCIIFTLGRTKDALGNDTAGGWLLTYKATSDNWIAISQYIVNGGGVQPAFEPGLTYILGSQNPSQTFAPGDVGVGVIIHFAGVSQQPGTLMLICNSNDVSTEGFVRLILYGQPRTYVQLNALNPRKAGAGTTANDTNARILLRYD